MKYGIMLLLVCGLISCRTRSGIGTEEEVVLPTKVVLTEIIVDSFPARAAFDEYWDTDSSGADMSVVLYEGNSTTTTYTTPVQRDIKKDKLPVSWTTPDINLAGKLWRLVLNDMDDGYEQQMAQLTFNGNTEEPVIVLKNNKGYLIRLRLEKR